MKKKMKKRTRKKPKHPMDDILTMTERGLEGGNLQELFYGYEKKKKKPQGVVDLM